MIAMISVCPRGCKAEFASRNALAWHMLHDERCYPDPLNESIASRIRERIGTLRGRIHFLLLKIPSTRGDDELLAHWYRVIISKQEVYDYETSSFHENPIKPRRVIESTKTESIGRLRRYIQEDDKKRYHKKHTERDAKGNEITIYEDGWMFEHDCVLASAQTQLRRSIEQSESRTGWAQGWASPYEGITWI